jgi:hypothetical protein
MNRLEAELRRLYLFSAQDPQAPHFASQDPLVGPDGQVRALVLELAKPATWASLAQVWEGVQADLDLPAPAIAVSGQGGCQLWFSLAQPVAPDAARAFLEALRTRYLGDVAPERIRLLPANDPSATSGVRHATSLPPTQVAPERWSAFVAPDLVPLFEDEPWLDHPPGIDAQADLLSRVASASPESFLRACERLHPAQPGQGKEAAAPSRVAGIAGPQGTHGAEPADEAADPRSFLLAVMRDPAVEMHLRIEAAKALLPYFTST